MTAVSTRQKPSRTIRFTGHPPPAVQIAEQTRSATGATFGNAARFTPAWHRAAVGRPVAPQVAAPIAPVVAVEQPGQSRAEVVLGVLLDVADRGGALPRCAELATLAGWRSEGQGTNGATRVSSTLRHMADLANPPFRMIAGSAKFHRGEMVIRLADGRELRTADAPSSWQVTL